MAEQHLTEQYRNIAEAFHAVAEQNPNAVAHRQSASGLAAADLSNESLSTSGKLRNWIDDTYATVRDRVDNVAAGLEDLGVKRGTRIALLSNTRPEWGEAELGIYSSGGSVVTCYTSDAADRIGFVLHDSKTEYVFVENQEQLDKILGLTTKKFMLPDTESAPAHETILSLKKIITFEDVMYDAKYNDLIIPYKSLRERTAPLPRLNYLDTAATDEASIIYTSGTTGAPKGVIATHGQHLSNVLQLRRSGLMQGVESVFQLLPLAHGFGLQLYHALLRKGGMAIFPRVLNKRNSQLTAEGKAALMRDLHSGDSNLVPLVPKVLEGMRAGILDKAQINIKQGIGEGVIKAALLKNVIKVYGAMWEAQQTGASPGLWTKFQYALLEGPGKIGPKVKEKLRETLVGKDFGYFVSGGARLDPVLNNFFWSLDMPVLEGYGTTELNVPVTCNKPGAMKIGSVGQVLDASIEMKIDTNGEILFRGPNIASGYLNRPQASAKVFGADGWVHTGDTGRIDADGFLYIEGRVDDMIVTSNGKNINPGPIEARMKEAPLVAEAVLAGHGREALVALVALDEVAVKKWAAAQQIKLTEPYHKDPAVLREVRKQVNAHANGSVKNAEKVMNAGLIPPLTVGNGLTPTLKVQRKKVIAMHAALVDALLDELNDGKKPLAA